MLCFLFLFVFLDARVLGFMHQTVFLAPLAIFTFLKPTEEVKGISSPVSGHVTFRIHHYEVKSLYTWHSCLFQASQEYKLRTGGQKKPLGLTEIAVCDRQPHQNLLESMQKVIK